MRTRKFCKFCLESPPCSSIIKAFRSSGRFTKRAAAVNCASPGGVLGQGFLWLPGPRTRQLSHIFSSQTPPSLLPRHPSRRKWPSSSLGLEVQHLSSGLAWTAARNPLTWGSSRCRASTRHQYWSPTSAESVSTTSSGPIHSKAGITEIPFSRLCHGLVPRQLVQGFGESPADSPAPKAALQGSEWGAYGAPQRLAFHSLHSSAVHSLVQASCSLCSSASVAAEAPRPSASPPWSVKISCVSINVPPVPWAPTRAPATAIKVQGSWEAPRFSSNSWSR